MLRSVLLFAVTLAACAWMPACPAFQMFHPENANVGRLISTLPDHIDPPEPLFVDEEPALRKEIAYRLLDEERHPLSALLTLLDAEPNGATTTSYWVNHLGSAGIKRLSLVLFRWMESDDERRRLKAWQFLHACRQLPVESIPSLTKFLFNERATDRSYACRLLGYMGEDAKSAAPQIAKLTRDYAAEVRADAIEALGNMQAAEYLASVHRGTSDVDEKVQLAAVIALFRLNQRDNESMLLLRKLHRTGTPEIRRTILKHLHEFGDPGPILLESWRDQVRDAFELLSLSKELECLGPAAADLLVELLAETESEETRRNALLLLQWTKHEKRTARPAVVAILSGDNKRLQLQALASLTTMGEILFDEVAKFMEASQGFQIAVADCLIHCPPEDLQLAIDALRILMDSDEVEVQLAACRNLQILGAEQNSVLKCLTLMLHPSREIGSDALQRAIQMLETAGPPAKMAIPLLIKSFTDERLTRFRDDQHPAVKAMIAIGEPAVPRLLRALDHDFLTVQAKATVCLKKIDNEQSAHPLAERVWDEALYPEIYGIYSREKLDPGRLQELNEETATLPIRLTKLLSIDGHNTQALEALSRLGAEAQEALPALLAHYEKFAKALAGRTAENGLSPSSRDFQITRMICERTAIAIYRIAPSRREPIQAELNRIFTAYANERRGSLISADLMDIAMELNFRNETAFQTLRERVDDDVFINPTSRAAAAYVLALVEPENPKWEQRLREIAEQAANNSTEHYFINQLRRLSERQQKL